MSTFSKSYDPGSNATSGSSAWERFLCCAGVPESGCASLVTSATGQGNAIRTRVRNHYATRYVPEHILEALGLRKQLTLRWQGDEQKNAPYALTGDAR
jgi:hypothetical protein